MLSDRSPIWFHNGIRRFAGAIKKALLPAIIPFLDVVTPVIDERLFDWVNGTETCRRVAVADLRTASPARSSAKPYMPVRSRILYRALSALSENIRDIDRISFIDFGAGKGKACIVAARLGFQGVIGVEFDSDLVDIANRNLDRALTARQRAATTVCHVDALEFTLPKTDIVAFFFNPFLDSVMAPVVEKLRRHAESGFTVYAVYVWALCIDQFEMGWETVWSDERSNIRTFIKRSRPESHGSPPRTTEREMLE